MRDIHKNKPGFLASECPLAADHLKQGVELITENTDDKHPVFTHPIQLLAHAWGLTPAPKSA
jgi:glycerol-3-phosphate dehydrogenase subunit C